MVEGTIGARHGCRPAHRAQKATLVLLQLGREWSAAVLASMTDDEVELIMSEVVDDRASTRGCRPGRHDRVHGGGHQHHRPVRRDGLRPRHAQSEPDT